MCKPIIIRSPLDFVADNVFYELSGILPGSMIYLKLEGFNFAGSIKLKPAIEMINALEQTGTIYPGRNRIVESSSGNTGVALSLVCGVKGYRFTCVSDSNITPINERHIRLLGGEVLIVKDRDMNGGYVHNRIKLIEQMKEEDPSVVWVNQYANPANTESHYKLTAREIFESFAEIDYLFVGAGTTGTLMGCVEYARRHSPQTRIVAVDVEGSVSFGNSPARRYIPGLGQSRQPELLKRSLIDEVVMVREEDTVKMCFELLSRHRLLVGGSTGTVLSGIRSYMAGIPANKRVVAISPDFGDRYLDTLYNSEWLQRYFPLLAAELPGHEQGVFCESSRAI
jgi:cysteine synthase A